MITGDSDEARLVEMQDHGLHIALGRRQSCNTMRHDVTFILCNLIDVPQKQCADRGLESLTVALHQNWWKYAQLTAAHEIPMKFAQT
jgi:hypothetical protein